MSVCLFLLFLRFHREQGEREKNVWTINFFLSFFRSSFSTTCAIVLSAKMCRFVAIAARFSCISKRGVRDENRSRSGNSGLQMIVATVVIDKMCYTFWHRSAFCWQREGNRKFSPCLHIIFASTSFKDDVGCLSMSDGVFADTFFRILTHADTSWRHWLTRLVFNVRIRHTSSVSWNCRLRRVVFGSSVKRREPTNLLHHECLRLHVSCKYSSGLIPSRITFLLHPPIKSRTNPKQRLFSHPCLPASTPPSKRQKQPSAI